MGNCLNDQQKQLLIKKSQLHLGFQSSSDQSQDHFQSCNILFFSYLLKETMKTQKLQVLKNPDQQNTSQLLFQEPLFNSAICNKRQVTLDDFICLEQIGKGAFGKVFRVKKRSNGKIYAMKQIQKKNIIENKLEQNTILERNVLKSSQHPFTVDLKYAFQTDTKIYFVMDYVSGGQFYKLLSQTGKLPEKIVQFVSAEVILALEHLHTNLKIIYRDLKPENILLCNKGHVKLTDFGLSTLKKNDEKTYTLAGTPEYTAPEIILKIGHSYEVDFWCLGVLIFEMLCGFTPFDSPTHNLRAINQMIIKNSILYPAQISSDARDLISRLLRTDPKKRLGTNGYNEIKNHPFFQRIDWKSLQELKIISPLKTFAEQNSQKQLNKPATGVNPILESLNSSFHQHMFSGISYNHEYYNSTYRFDSIKQQNFVY